MASKPDPSPDDPVPAEDPATIPGPDGPIADDDFADKIDEIGEPSDGNFA